MCRVLHCLQRFDVSNNSNDHRCSDDLQVEKSTKLIKILPMELKHFISTNISHHRPLISHITDLKYLTSQTSNISHHRPQISHITYLKYLTSQTSNISPSNSSHHRPQISHITNLKYLTLKQPTSQTSNISHHKPYKFKYIINTLFIFLHSNIEVNNWLVSITYIYLENIQAIYMYRVTEFP